MNKILAMALVCGWAGCTAGNVDTGGDQPSVAGNLTLADLPVNINPPIAGTFTQQIDHPVVTDPSNPPASIGTFQQRYWYSTDFATAGANSPVIFYFCGEAACDPAYAYTMADTAKSLNAAIVVLEHRYYGESAPFPDYTLDHMQYLNIHNALEDAAAFETWAKTNLPLAGKWIAVGGSYPGMLAAFYREQHPELVVGAWASSAPVNVQLSFMGYDQIVAKALGSTCTGEMQRLLTAFDKAWNDQANNQAVADDFFGGTFPASEADMMNEISNYAEEGAQYGQQQALCAALLQDANDVLEGFKEYLNPPLPGAPTTVTGTPGQLPAPHFSLPPGTLLPPGSTALAAPAAATSTTTLADFHGNEWFYQVCTEVGFYQVKNTASNESVLSPLIDEAYWANECQQFVGTAPNVSATNATYYAPLAANQVSNVLFVNGSDDPWSTLSFNEKTKTPAQLTSFVVKTGSHCQDLYNLTPQSVLGVFQAHTTFYGLATTWLAQ